MTILAVPEYLLTSQLQGMSCFDIRAAGQSFAGTATLSGDHVTLRSCMWKCGCHAGSGQSDRTLAISQPSAKRRKAGLKKKEWAKGFPCCGFWKVDTGIARLGEAGLPANQFVSRKRCCCETYFSHHALALFDTKCRDWGDFGERGCRFGSCGIVIRRTYSRALYPGRPGSRCGYESARMSRWRVESGVEMRGFTMI